jgi:hypothetical protein
MIRSASATQYLNHFFSLYYESFNVDPEVLRRMIEYYLSKNNEAFLRTMMEKPDYFYEEYKKTKELMVTSFMSPEVNEYPLESQA